MTRRDLLVILMALSAVVLVVTVGATRVRAAHARVAAAESAVEQARHDAARLEALQRRQQTVARARRPTQEVIAQINSVLSHAGLSERLFRSLTPEASTTYGQSARGTDGTAGGSVQPLQKQSLRLSLQALSPQELGRFLATWRAEQPLWSVTRIDLVHQRASSGERNVYDASLVLTAVYVEDA